MPRKHIEQTAVFPSLGEEGSSAALTLAACSGRARCRGPEPTEFRVRETLIKLPPGAGSLLLAFVHWLLPSPRGAEKRDPSAGRGKGWRQLHQTNLKSRSRPWLWSVKRMKASMAPSSRPSVALGSVVSPKGAAPSSRGSVSLRTPEGLGLPVPWGRRIFPRTTSQASGLGRKLWLLRRRQTAVPGE